MESGQLHGKKESKINGDTSDITLTKSSYSMGDNEVVGKEKGKS